MTKNPQFQEKIFKSIEKQTGTVFADPTSTPKKSTGRTSPFFSPSKTPRRSSDKSIRLEDIQKSAAKQAQITIKGTKKQTESYFHYIPRLSAKSFGLIQETVRREEYKLLVAVVLLNRTKGTASLPVFWRLLNRFPTLHELASADIAQLLEVIGCLGFQSRRARTIKIVACHLEHLEQNPIDVERRVRTLHYPKWDSGTDIKPKETLGPSDPREGAWEIGGIHGIGKYALDSWRIFCRDRIRGLATDYDGTGAMGNFEAEWKRVLPEDKELRAFFQWKWLQEKILWIQKQEKKTKCQQIFSVRLNEVT